MEHEIWAARGGDSGYMLSFPGPTTLGSEEKCLQGSAPRLPRGYQGDEQTRRHPPSSIFGISLISKIYVRIT